MAATSSVVAFGVRAAEADAATAPEVPADTTFVEGGLLSQIFARIGDWFDGLLDQARTVGSAFMQMRDLGPWWDRVTATPGAQEAIMVGTAWVIGILALAWVLETLVGRLLKRPRLLVQAHAERQAAATLPKRIPYALAHALLYLIPLAAFLATTGVMSNAFLTGTRAYFVVLAFANAYAGVRVALAVARLLVSPVGERLRLFHMSDDRARFAYGWAKTIFIVSGLGVAIGEALIAFGASADLQVLVMKVSALIVHIMLIVVVIQSRHTVTAFLRGPDTAPAEHSRRSGLSTLRAFLAEIWVVLAVVFIAAMWLVWALSVANGFQRVIHFIAATAAVLVVARILSLIAFGLLDSGFSRLDPLLEDRPAAATSRYRALLRVAVYFVIGVGTILALLEVWGLPVLSWFATGTVGRRLASAVWTISIAVLLAIVAWEAAGYFLNRRIGMWTASGDMVRVARLRTLLPIMRSALLVVIGLVVLFTALSELGVNTAPLLASAGILSAALAFGSQNLVKDFVTGIFLLMENTMQVGDSVTVAGVSGSVEYLSVRTVRLRAGDGSLHVVPFSSVTTVNNANRGLGNASVRVSVTADTDLPLVYDTLRAIGADMRADPAYSNLILADLDIWGVDQIDGSSATIAGQIRTIDRGRWPVQREFNRRVLNRFRELDIRLSNPKETVLLSQTDNTTKPE